jgi:NADH-quinone oxidoreductase subunit G
MAKVTINQTEYEVPDNITIIQACDYVGIEVPRFCYHDRLSVAGNCRMCLVELEKGPPKPIASCATNVADGMVIKTNSEMVVNARKGVNEFLLANHPLDCPICDQGGECDLQDQAYLYGVGKSDFIEEKRAVEDKSFGPLVQTQMTRCIHCMRCVRFATEISGVEELGAIGRGENAEVVSSIEGSLTSELSGNIIDLCPVGALTSKPYAFTARSWELTKTESIDVHDAVGSNIRIDSKGQKVMRILPRLNEDINEEWINDKTRFSYDGLALQRLDRPYIRKNGKLVVVSWNEALKYAVEKIKLTQQKKQPIAALSGELSDVETLFIAKKLMHNLGSKDYDIRPKNSIMQNNHRSDYLFNSTINKIDQADLFLLIGTNPRVEAAIINARIGTYVRNKNKSIVYNIGVENDLTYPYIQLGNNWQVLQDILQDNNDFAAKLQNAKKPMIIIGEGCFQLDDAERLLEMVTELCNKYQVINNEWNGFNVLHHAAARVGGLDIKFTPEKNTRDTKQILADGHNSQKNSLVFLLGYDDKNVVELTNSFNIYIGSHGDAGVKVADVILPAATYTEKTATYVNMEGRVQKTNKAVSLVGEAQEDWQVINKISKLLSYNFYKNINDLSNDLSKEYPVFANNEEIVRDNNISAYKALKSNVLNQKFSNIITNFFRTNVIARASQTMAKCTKEILKN